jgi:hypothetical protein
MDMLKRKVGVSSSASGGSSVGGSGSSGIKSEELRREISSLHE